MDELWYRELGFYSNPFSIKPAAFTNEVVGHRLANIFKLIDNGEILYIVGPFGTGKTTLLKHIVGRYGGQGKVIYFSCGLERSMDVPSLLRGAGGFFQRLAGSTPRDIIFLVDEASDIFPKDAKELFAAHEEGIIRSIVLVGTSIPSSKLPSGMASKMRPNVINVKSLPPAEAITLVRNRVGKLPLLSDQAIKAAHKRADGNTRLMLEYCEELCRYAVAHRLSKITPETVDEVFPAPPKKERPKKVKARKRYVRPLDQAIEEAVIEVEENSPVMEGLAPIKDDEPLPLYDSPMKDTKKKKK